LVKTYDAWALELVAKQKCYYHIIRSIDKVLEDKAGSARALGGTLKTLLKDAIALLPAVIAISYVVLASLGAISAL